MMEIDVYSSIVPIRSSGWKTQFVSPKFLKQEKVVIVSCIPTPMGEWSVETLPDSILVRVECLRYHLRVELWIYVAGICAQKS